MNADTHPKFKTYRTVDATTKDASSAIIHTTNIPNFSERMAKIGRDVTEIEPLKK